MQQYILKLALANMLQPFFFTSLKAMAVEVH